MAGVQPPNVEQTPSCSSFIASILAEPEKTGDIHGLQINEAISGQTELNPDAGNKSEISEASTAQGHVVDLTDSTDPPKASKRNYKTPIQDTTTTEIASLSDDVIFLQRKKDAGLASDAQLKQLKEAKDDLQNAKAKLQKLKQNQARQKRKRDTEKLFLSSNPEIAEQMKRRKLPGRPSLESCQDGLNSTILEIATYGSAVDSRRRTESFRSVRTLDDLHRELLILGFEVSTIFFLNLLITPPCSY